MIRIVCKETDHTELANIPDGQAYTSIKTFDVNLPEVELWLTEQRSYLGRQFIGIEIVENIDVTQICKE